MKEEKINEQIDRYKRLNLTSKTIRNEILQHTHVKEIKTKTKCHHDTTVHVDGKYWYAISEEIKSLARLMFV